MRPELVPAGIASSTAPSRVGTRTLAPEHRLVERDREVEPQVGALAREQRMRRDRDRDQEIAGAAAGAGKPLALQPDGLTVVQPGRNLHVDLLAGRELHALPGVPFAASASEMVSAAVMSWPPRARPKSCSSNWKHRRPAGRRGPRRAAECFLQDILEASEAAKSAAGAPAAR